MVDSHQVRGQVRGFQVPVPADQHRGEANEAVQQRDQLRHPGHFHDPGTPEPDGPADQHRGHEQDQAGQAVACAPGALEGQPDSRGQGDDHARDAVDDPCSGLLVLAQTGKAEDEQQGRDDVGRPRNGVGGQRTGDGVRHGKAPR